MATGKIPKYADGTDSGWKNTGISFASGTLYYRVIGNVCYLAGDGCRLIDALPTGGSVNLGKMAAAATPTNKRAMFPSNSLAGYGFFVLQADGDFYLYNRSGNTYTGGTSGSRLFIASCYLLD
jgi:hypothetical protein